MQLVYTAVCRIVSVAALVGLLSTPAVAVDGVVEINQERALVGGVSPGDLPGFPVSIYASGSYRLTGNLLLPDVNTDGIVIVASNVAIDLNGFTMIGRNSCGFSDEGVTCTAEGTGTGIQAASLTSPSNISLRNGTVRGMGDNGIQLATARNCLVDRVMVYGNGGLGIRLSDGSVTNSTVRVNLTSGISGGPGCVVSGDSATRNGNRGISVYGCTVSGNSATWNFGDGIFAVGESAIIGNTVYANEGFRLNLTATNGYASNVIQANRLGTVDGGVEIGTNMCGSDTVCP